MTSDATADYLDALCFLQQKSTALFQLLDDAAKQALVTAAQRAVAQATVAVAPREAEEPPHGAEMEVDEASDTEGSDYTTSKRKRHQPVADPSSGVVPHGSSYLTRQHDNAARKAASAAARLWNETSATAVRNLFAEVVRKMKAPIDVFFPFLLVVSSFGDMSFS